MVMPNVIDAFASFDCSKNIYWGTSAGMSHHFGFYMRGLGYALSWPLVRRPALGRVTGRPYHTDTWPVEIAHPQVAWIGRAEMCVPPFGRPTRCPR